MGTGTDTIERDIVIDAPADRVWSLITQAEHLGTWFGDSGADIDLRPGGALEVRWDGHQLNGTVEAVEPFHRFAFRWQQTDVADGIALADGNSTLVEFTLTEDAGATRVQVTESGFASLSLPVEDRTSMHTAHTEGWEREIAELGTHAAALVA